MDFSSTEAGPNTSGSSSYISASLFLTLSYNFTLSAFEFQILNSMEYLNSDKHFIRLISLPTVHLNRTREVAIFTFLKNKQETRKCVVSNFNPGMEKNVSYMENSKFSSRVEI